MENKINDFLKPRRVAIISVILIIAALFVFFLFSAESYLKVDVLVIWAFASLAVLYQSGTVGKPLSKNIRIFVIILGILLCVLSFVNVPLGFGNPPYSIGDFSLLLSGIGLIVFGILRFDSFIVPITLPAIAVIGFQIYELFLRHQDWITAPLIPVTVTIAVTLLHLLGIPAISNDNTISFFSVDGAPIHLTIVPDCTGIWSLGTFTITVLIVVCNFPMARTKKAALLIGIGYIGTYIANHLRILLIGLSGYFYGPSGLIEDVHIHIGWIIFTLWMIIFWYYFFTRQLEFSFWSKTRS